jgi:hypothetical protein
MKVRGVVIVCAEWVERSESRVLTTSRTSSRSQVNWTVALANWEVEERRVDS